MILLGKHEVSLSAGRRGQESALRRRWHRSVAIADWGRNTGRGCAILADYQRIVRAAGLDLLHLGELNVECEGDCLAQCHRLPLQHALYILCDFLCLKLNECLNTVVVLRAAVVLGQHNDLFHGAVCAKDLEDNARGDLRGGGDIVVRVEHRYQQGLGAVLCRGQLLMGAVPDVDTSAVDLREARVLEELHHLLGSLWAVHLNEGLVLLAQHDEVTHTTKGLCKVLNTQLGYIWRHVAEMNNGADVTNLVVARWLRGSAIVGGRAVVVVHVVMTTIVVVMHIVLVVVIVVHVLSTAASAATSSAIPVGVHVTSVEVRHGSVVTKLAHLRVELLLMQERVHELLIVDRVHFFSCFQISKISRRDNEKGGSFNF